MSQKAPSVIDYFHPNGSLYEEAVVYGEITFPNGVKSILFKCRQRKNLTGFIRKVLEIASWPLDRIHNDFRTSL